MDRRSDVKYQWNDEKRKPLDHYDLCDLEVMTPYGEKIILGWWTGSGWDGAKLQDNYRVLRWKKNQSYDTSYYR